MAIDKATVLRIAELARIDVKDEALDGLADELNAILSWIEQLSEVDTEGVAPMTSVVEVKLPRRDDGVSDGGMRDDILANAPEAEDGLFVVPKVIE